MSRERELKILSVQSGIEQEAGELCRLCARNIEGETLSIFQDNFHESLEEFLGVSIGRKDLWPKSVCQKCVLRATESIKFVRSVRESEKLFTGIYGANGSVVEFVVTDVAGGVQQDFEDSDGVEIIEDQEILEDGEVIDDSEDGFAQRRLSVDCGEVQCTQYVAQEEREETLPAVLVPRRRYKTDEDFRRAEAFYALSCTYCLVAFERLKELRAHYREMHQQEGFVLCCGKKLFRLTYMLDHMEYHSNQEAFKCDQCGKCLDSQLHLKTHQQQAHPRIYSHRKKVIERLSEANKLNRFDCSHCGKEFDYKVSLEKHVQQLHQGGIRCVCRICRKQFKCRISYQRHMRNHEENGQII
ncbi:zinc finger protein 510-like [Phlebotomus argentipes]|uniref:zinc finger protein 510-like n=1 Tax=Phlebotomus argentipes TaxID=94469 RepID=UPI0028935637|nr:zinc finger protein 510-like [Phlebotomus argentipes]